MSIQKILPENDAITFTKAQLRNIRRYLYLYEERYYYNPEVLYKARCKVHEILRNIAKQKENI